jgi:hypothetical protein
LWRGGPKDTFQTSFHLLLVDGTNPADYPNNGQFALHFGEFLHYGYRIEAESVMCKFPFSDGSRQIDDWTVGTVDGQTKVLLMLSIVAICYELELKIGDLGPLASTLRSFKFVRCGYKHYDHPGSHFLHSLSSLARNCVVRVFLFNFILLMLATHWN